MSASSARLRIGIGTFALGGALCAWLGGLGASLGFCAGAALMAVLGWRREPVARRVVVVRRAKSQQSDEGANSDSQHQVDHAASPIEAREPATIRE